MFDLSCCILCQKEYYPGKDANYIAFRKVFTSSTESNSSGIEKAVLLEVARTFKRRNRIKIQIDDII